jgi:predicted component of type VI protein secretion system
MDSASGPTWDLTATADRAYFERVDADGVDFPIDRADRCFGLDQDRAMIGRSSARRGIYPDIDLSGPPTDTGISHMHAVLVRRTGGPWGVVDPGSTNGTYLNDSSEPIRTDEWVPLANGDQLHIGAWTTLTLRSTTDCTKAHDQPEPPLP